jgi:prevent-host-death family protein
MSRVGIRDLKNQLSRYLEDVEKGERIGVTRRGKVIAYLVPAGESKEAEKLAEMVREGLATWSGGTPKGSRRRAQTEGKAVSEIILEDRN